MLPLTVRVDSEDTRSADMLLQDGWREGDEIVTYIRDIGQPLGNRIVRKAVKPDMPQIISIASAAFAPKDKTKWIEDAFANQERNILVAETSSGLVGFVIVRYEKNAAVIDLIGTSTRRKGYGTVLVESVCHLRHGKPYIQAGTQAKNETAREFYRHLGFVVKYRRRTFHKP